MEDLKKRIYEHDSDLNVTHKINTIELDNWINHLKYIKKELNNLIILCGKELNQQIEVKVILQQFQKKETENDTILSALQRFMNSREQIIECEDTQCDMAYITQHESYRRSYLYHVDKYRKLKDEFFKKIQDKFNILKIN